MNEKIIKPEWFDDWFNKKFPLDTDDFTIKDLSFAFRVTDEAIRCKLKACEIDHIRSSKGVKSSYIIPRQAVYNFALSCYCLNDY